MYLREIAIENIRSIKDFELSFETDECAGWHVLLGDNGAGKSTLVRSIALALVGPTEAPALRQNWSDWLRRGEDAGSIRLSLYQDPQYDKASGSGKTSKNATISAKLNFNSADPAAPNGPVVTVMADKGANPLRYIWGQGEGWFSASYGPFRRFSGGDKAYEKLFYSNPKLAPHLTAFGEDVALTEALAWLHTHYVMDLEDKQAFKADQKSGQILAGLKSFINDGKLLPHGTELTGVTSAGVQFRDGTGATVAVDQLSDGYRSVLSLTFELIRQMVQTYGYEKVFRNIQHGTMEIDLPGVVLIDEVDAHLHPPWQRRIGTWFCQYFPNIQFLVTTHSPLVCQAADKGSVWRLPTPGSEVQVGRVKGNELNRLLYGNILEAYSTEMFGSDIQRSEVGAQKLDRLAQLSLRSRRGKKLTPEEIAELRKLRAAFPLSNDTAHEANGEVK